MRTSTEQQATNPSPTDALTTLRSDRRARHRSDTEPFDAFYRLYVTGLIGLFAFYFALGLVDDVTVDAGGIMWARDNGALWVSLVASVAVALGARSGANGGPLAIDELELHHVVLSPLPRPVVLRDPVRRLLAATVAAGAVLGAASGELASRQLPGAQIEWVLSGLLVGTAIALSGVGAALVTTSLRVDRRIVVGCSLIPPVWAVVDLVTGVATSPTSGFGRLALWPLDAHPAAAVAIVTPIVLVWLGYRRIGALSVERAHHRSRLVAQIRFAIAQQDLRSLLLLRRQLAFETPRAHPWVPVPGRGRVEARFPVVVRDARSYAHWPLSRVIRVVGLATIAGLALGAMWQGTTALIGVVGAALYLAAIEVIEPLSQELDHPGMLELIPVNPGRVILGHVFSAAVAMTAVWGLVGAIAVIVTLDEQLAVAVAVAFVPAALVAVTAACLSIRRFGAPGMAIPPEVEGPRMLLRLIWPPALTLAGAVPLLLARNAAQSGSPEIPPAINGTAVVAMLGAAAVAWIRFRDEMIEATAAQKQAL